MIEEFNAEIGRQAIGMSPVKPYEKLRKDLAQRDRSLREKVVALEEARRSCTTAISVGIGGSTMSRTPMALIWALIRARRKKLTCAAASPPATATCCSARASRAHHHELVQPGHPLGRVQGDAALRGDRQGALRGVEPPRHGHALACRRHGRAVHADPPMLGSDVLRELPEAKEIDCPFTNEKLLLVPALNPDVALIHVQRCDAYGNAQIDGLQFMDIDLAMAANKVILSTERIVSNDQIRRAPDQTKIPFFTVDAMVEVPFGSAPHECYGIYEPMMRHMEYYVGLVNKDPVGGMQDYLDRFVYGPKSWTDVPRPHRHRGPAQRRASGELHL